MSWGFGSVDSFWGARRVLGTGDDFLSWVSSGYDIPLDPDEHNLTCIDAF